MTWFEIAITSGIVVTGLTALVAVIATKGKKIGEYFHVPLTPYNCLSCNTKMSIKNTWCWHCSRTDELRKAGRL